MGDAPRLFIVAGEPSGDRLGADLVKNLRVRMPVSLLGVGGPELEGEGLRPLFPMSDLSVMGIRDVIVRLPLLYLRLRQTVAAILAARPEIVLLIDSQVFSQNVAKRLRTAGYVGKILLYVAPSVWAWKPERAATLRGLFDEVLAVLPFEPRVMKDLGGPRTVYVGHPAVQQSAVRDRPPERGPLLLLPGSRRGELRRHLSLMHAAAQRFRNHPRLDGFVVPAVRSQAGHVREAVARWKVSASVAVSPEDRHRAFAGAVAAVAVTGTVTLELALAGIPMVTTYVADAGQMRVAERYKVRFAALPNIVLRREVVPELIGRVPRIDDVASALDVVLDNGEAAAAQLASFSQLRALMRDGAPDSPRVDPAGLLVDYFRLLTGT